MAYEEWAVPNDDRELDRLDLTHNMFLLTFSEQLGTAPPNAKNSNVKRVLDVGTGTGIWAIEFGEEHPQAEILGVDLSATWPSYTPPNVEFEIDDIEEPWTYSRPFDYIHSRVMTSGISSWETYIRKCFDNLSPGGYLELNEIDPSPLSDDGTLRSDSAIMKSVGMLQEAASIFGRPYHNPQALLDILTKVGFRDVTAQSFKWPTNTWPKDPKYRNLGAWCHENLVAGWEGFCLAPFTRALGWTKEEVLVLMMQVRKEFSDRNIHAYFPVDSWSIYARKPTEEETERD
ncbi:Trans-aconitate 2-methyltransferase 9 [Colletotrichum chlorophyti]|uniref:Trans-aconitate 2-methyltransferase 9 n=1 Tax=Colletotrichum chlorophyti TaxID=708187 RepID=A0A1Q8RP48_9PEZI|nr:Trans-aconitate 2-methyltransferase 9 [Colletotrichum chlorophyti]